MERQTSQADWETRSLIMSWAINQNISFHFHTGTLPGLWDVFRKGRQKMVISLENSVKT